VPQLRSLPRFPAVRRDLTLDLAEKTRYADIEQMIRELNLDHLEEIEHVTTYRGKQLAKGQKSVTIALIFRSSSGTLTSQEIDGSMERVIEAANQSLAATVRA